MIRVIFKTTVDFGIVKVNSNSTQYKKVIGQSCKKMSQFCLCVNLKRVWVNGMYNKHNRVTHNTLEILFFRFYLFITLWVFKVFNLLLEQFLNQIPLCVLLIPSICSPDDSRVFRQIHICVSVVVFTFEFRTDLLHTMTLIDVRNEYINKYK